MKRRRSTHGFSTADVLAGLALSMLTLGSVYSFFLAQQKALATQQVYAQSQTITRTLVDLFLREVRMATYDPAGTALTTSPGPSCPGVKQGIVDARPTLLHFQQDLDGDGTIGAAGEDVTYLLSGNDVQRQEGKTPPVTLVSGVAMGGLTFRYFDGANPANELIPTGTPAALTAGQRDCVAKVEVTVTASLANPDPHNTAPILSRADSQVAIRSRSLANF